MSEGARSTTGEKITVRRPTFGLSTGLPAFWHGGDAFRTHLFDAMSVMFPPGERLFIDTIRAAREHFDEPALRARASAFVAQEANHSRVHGEYNEVLGERGYDVAAMEARLWRRFARLSRRHTLKTRLAVVLAYEHVTTELAVATLRWPFWLDGADAHYAALWRWHAAEEIEHKSVVMEAYRALGGGYTRRVAAMITVTLWLWIDLVRNHLSMMRRDGLLWNPQAIWRGFVFTWLRPGMIPRLLPGYLAWYKPRFDPDSRDTGALLAAWRSSDEPGLEFQETG